MKRRIEMSKNSIFIVTAIFVCLLMYTGCGKNSDDQARLELVKVKAELEAAKIQLKEAEKLKTEYDKLYVVNQNLNGQLDAERHKNEEYIKRINQDQQTIKELQQQLQK